MLIEITATTGKTNEINELGSLAAAADAAAAVVFSESVLWSFGATGDNGENPSYGRIADGRGDLYGTTGFGGANVELSPPFGKQKKWSEGVLWSFGAGVDGASPSGLIANHHGEPCVMGQARAGEVIVDTLRSDGTSSNPQRLPTANRRDDIKDALKFAAKVLLPQMPFIFIGTACVSFYGVA